MFFLQASSILLPQIDDVSSLIEQDDCALARYPTLAVKLRFQLFPSILPWPEVVRTQGNRTMAWYHLIKCNANVLL